LAVTQFSLAVLFLPRNGVVVTAAFVVMAIAMGAVRLLWIPRITASRRTAELREGRSTLVEQGRQQRRTAVWFVVALVLGGTPIVVAWFLRW
ncbi:MAG: hypothetical protein ABJF01_17510, partial [bacterium]